MVFLVYFAALANVGDNSTAIAYLKTMQLPSGGFITQYPADGTAPKPSLRTTRTALRAFRYLGAEAPNREQVIRFLHACHDSRSGGFCDAPGLPPDPISTAVGLMILGELKLPADPLLEAGLRFMDDSTKAFEQVRMVASALEQLKRTVPNASKWLHDIESARNADGSFGTGPGRARTTALNVVAQMRLGGKPDAAIVLRILRAGQRDDGGFGGDQSGGSDLEACYRVVRLFARLKTLPVRVDQLRTFIESCRNDDGGYGRTPSEPSSLHGTYYATIVGHWLAGGE